MLNLYRKFQFIGNFKVHLRLEFQIRILVMAGKQYVFLAKGLGKVIFSETLAGISSFKFSLLDTLSVVMHMCTYVLVQPTCCFLKPRWTIVKPQSSQKSASLVQHSRTYKKILVI